MTQRYFLLLSAMAAAAGVNASAAADIVTGPTNLRVASVDVVPRDGKLTVTMAIDPKNIRPGRDREVTFSPVVRSLSSPDSLELPVFKVCGRNRYYSHVRNNDLADGDVILEAGHADTYTYTVTVPWAAWMETSEIDMRETTAHCCDAPVPYCTTPVARIDLTPRSAILPEAYVALTGDSTITRQAEGRAFITFVVNRTEFDSTYMENPKELRKIYSTIDLVKNDRDAIITYISIKGYASPEGSYSNNVRLAMGRTQRLKEIVRAKYAFDPEIMHADYEPEDWQGLLDWLADNEIPHRDEIMQIAASQMEPDPRNEEIKRRYPEQYAMLLRDVYPWLRHSDYVVKYNIRTYTDLAELRRLYAEDPSKLRPVDFQRIAATYPQDSQQYRDVMMTAVKTWPYDELANVNAANIALREGDTAAAAHYLTLAGQTAEAYFTRASLAARTGDLKQAVDYMKHAAELGYAPAEAEVTRLIELRDNPRVEYLLPQEVYVTK